MMQKSIRAPRGPAKIGTHALPDSLTALGITMTRFAVWLARLRGNRFLRAAALLLIASVLALGPVGARAACTITAGPATGTVSFSPPTTITVPFNAAVGTVIYTSGSVAPTSANTMDCTSSRGAGTIFGVTNNAGTTPGTSVTVYPTSIPGVGYSIGHNAVTTLLAPYPCCNIADGSYTNSNPSFLILIKTGPIISGSTVPAGILAFWKYDTGQNIEAFTLANSVTILDPACSVNTTPINVTLPTVSASSMNATGTTAGRTPFTIALTCSSGANIDIQLDFAGTASGITGVLTKTSGTAVGVGVQLLDSTFNPVTFGTKTLVGATPTGPLNIKYYANYYRTAAITPGSLAASATFTLSYQ
jgi:type 1 fimbria pilin